LIVYHLKNSLSPEGAIYSKSIYLTQSLNNFANDNRHYDPDGALQIFSPRYNAHQKLLCISLKMRLPLLEMRFSYDVLFDSQYI